MSWADSGLTIDAVFDAYFDCRRTKRNSINQLRFEIDLEKTSWHCTATFAAGIIK
jgi:hypothetical protein